MNFPTKQKKQLRNGIWRIKSRFSLPKCAGVECIIDGYIGAAPIPIITSPVNAKITFETGKSISNIPTKIIPIPKRIMFLSPSLSQIKPEKNLPKVIPI